MTDIRIDQLFVDVPPPTQLGGAAVSSESFADVLMTEVAPALAAVPTPTAQAPLGSAPAAPDAAQAAATAALKQKRHLLIPADDEAALAGLAAQQRLNSPEIQPADTATATGPAAATADAPKTAATRASAPAGAPAPQLEPPPASSVSDIPADRSIAAQPSASKDAPLSAEPAADAVSAPIAVRQRPIEPSVQTAIEPTADAPTKPSVAAPVPPEAQAHQTSSETANRPSPEPLAASVKNDSASASPESLTAGTGAASVAANTDDSAIVEAPQVPPQASAQQVPAQAAARLAELQLTPSQRSESPPPPTTGAPGEIARRGQASPQGTSAVAGNATGTDKTGAAASSGTAGTAGAAGATNAGTPPNEPASTPTDFVESLKTDPPADVGVETAGPEIVRDLGEAPRSVHAGSASVETRVSGPAPAGTTSAAERVARADLVSSIKTNVEDGVREFSISLDPENLGRVDVRVEIDEQGQVDIHIMADNAEAIEALEEDRDLLKSSLEALGSEVDLGSLTFSLNDGSSENGQPDRPPARAGKFVNLTALTSATALDAEALGRIGLQVMARDRVDLYT